MRCRFFTWLAVRNRCWTGDRLQRHGLPHPARQVWEPILALWGHLDWRPEGDSDIREWWATAAVPQGARRDFRTATALHRNNVVFNGASPSYVQILRFIIEEAVCWESARLIRDAFPFRPLG
ncbi:hypothetical protein BRADI_5g08686v3 [Brachypodium distachyon]|uniref:Reverse transcriptase zinc-binding domain-containing protein n=1 Tax=Brachypodium distachyon TaxID=15368 RepID=A0A0Q3P130_BRADI|nr:hypothetical protein BRADI_5g08686v3 [Brachypodium distachyon]